MPARRVVTAVALAVAALGLSAYAFGGWAVITVDDLPETVFANQSTTLSFVVRQHGATLLSNLNPTVVATDGKTEVSGTVRAGETGHYSSTLVIPHGGDWTVTIYSGFLNVQTKLPTIRALPPGATPPKPRMLADRGERLFIAKGCVTCHVHATPAAEGYRSLEVGPDLTPKRYEAEYLKRFLADPSISRTAGRPEMPKLGLSSPEITALVAFINNDRGVATRQ